jgi:N-methylhydantoinase B/oxoprolinase/acetone carboxylase alpha subunit
MQSESTHLSSILGVDIGGDGLCRELIFLAPATVTLLTDRRKHAPYGLSGSEHSYNPERPDRSMLN